MINRTIAIILLSLSLTGCVVTAALVTRAVVDVATYVTKEPQVVVRTAECGNVDRLTLSRDDTEETKDLVLKQTLQLEALCDD